MITLFTAVTVYLVVFGLDYVRFRYFPNSYRYVSWETYTLLILGQSACFVLLWGLYQPFLTQFWLETAFITPLFVIYLFFAWALSRERVLVCHGISRQQHCYSPGYVLVKSADVMFQQFIYLAIALSVFPLLGSGLWAYFAYTSILLLMHSVVVLSLPDWPKKLFTFGILILAAPIYYAYIELGYFWPAVYIHSMLYVFLWLGLGDWDAKPGVTRVTS